MSKMHIIIGIVMCFFLCTICYGQTQDALNARTKGYTLQKEGKSNDAIKEYLNATQLDPHYAAPHNDLGVLYEESGQLKQAEQAYLKAVSIDPNYAGVYSNLAALYERQGQAEKAIYYWKKRSTLGGPNDPWAQKAAQKVSELSNIPPTNFASSSTVPAPTITTPAALQPSAKSILSDAKKDIRHKRYQDAIDKLQKARNLTDDNRPIDEMLYETREKAIDQEIAMASLENKVYKRSKLLEVEDYWYPPVAEPDAGKITASIDSLSSKSPARLILEKRARQIIPSIDFTDARLRDVVEYLALSNDINIVIDEEVVTDVSGVTIHLKNIPLIEALAIILRTKGLKYRFEDNIVWITTAEKLAQEDLVVKVYDVQDLIGKIHDFPSQPFDISKSIRQIDEGKDAE